MARTAISRGTNLGMGLLVIALAYLHVRNLARHAANDKIFPKFRVSSCFLQVFGSGPPRSQSEARNSFLAQQRFY
jgi:hypothetical protein